MPGKTHELCQPLPPWRVPNGSGVCQTEGKDGGCEPSGSGPGKVRSLLRGPREPQSRRSLWKKAPAIWGGKTSRWRLAWAGGVLGTEHRPPSPRGGEGGVGGWRKYAAVSWWFGGKGGASSTVSSLKGVSPGPGVSTARGEGKTYQRKSQSQVSPRPALPSLFPGPAAPRTLHAAGRREAPSSGTARGHDTGLEGRGWWLWRSPRRVGRSVRGWEPVHVPGHQTLASSISRKSLCMGTLPCSLTL